MHAKLAGVVTKEDMGKHSLTLKTTGGKTFLVYTNKATKYTHLKSYESLKKGQHLASKRRSGNPTTPTGQLSIAKMASVASRPPATRASEGDRRGRSPACAACACNGLLRAETTGETLLGGTS